MKNFDLKNGAKATQKFTGSTTLACYGQRLLLNVYVSHSGTY
jgi:hypothetical protein